MVFADAAAAREASDALQLCTHKPSLLPVVTAATSRMALTAILKHKPEVIVADCAPDDVSGTDLLKALRAVASEAILVYYVRECTDASAASALRAGAFDVIPRPAPERLAAALDRAIDQAALRRDLELAQRNLAGAHHAEFLPLMMDALAHDLRNMLQPLTYASQILKRSSEQGMQPLQDSLEGSTQRGLDIVEAMLAFGSDRSRGRGVVDVQELLRTVRLLLPTSLARRVAIACESPLTTVRCGPHQTELEQCLLALARRALRHMPGGRLGIRIERQLLDGTAVIRLGVEAEGAGPAWPSTPECRELLLCRLLAARHGGTVHVVRGAGGKESIELLLPLLERTPSGSIGERRVLIAAGDDATPALMEAGIAAGFHAVAVTDSAGAEQHLATASMPDFAVIDTDLSQLEGARVFSLLRKRGFRGRIVLLASPGSEFSLSSSDESVFYMTKPVDGGRVFGALQDELLISGDGLTSTEANA